MAASVKKLVAYRPKDFPKLSGANQDQYFTTELRNIRNAINSIHDVLNAASQGVVQKSGLPTNADLLEGTSGLFKDTSGGGVYLAYNDGGTVKKVALT